MMISGWRAVVLIVAGLLVVGLLLAVVFWIGVLLAGLSVLAWFNLIVLPRLARRTRIPALVLAVALLPLLAAIGFAAAGLSGAIGGCGIWLIGVVVPRVLVWRLQRRLAQSRYDRAPVRQIDAPFRIQ
jgi:hypothetical protein